MNLELPCIVGGARWRGAPEHRMVLRSAGGEIAVPAFDDACASAILAQDPWLLASVPLGEIVAFLHNVGHNWKSSEYARRRTYIRQLVNHLGYSQKMADTEANWIAMLLSSHYRHYDALATELGDFRIVDEWVKREEAEVRALPCGRAFHLVPGNVPLSSVSSVLRAVLTKNVSVVKASSTDPITPVALALSFMDVDPDHPVCRALSVVHWRGGTEGDTELRLLRNADVVCAWGGAEAIAWAARNAPPAVEVVKFGPRRSLAVVGAGADLDKAARGLAHDVSMYDQRACFSVQHVFVEQALEAFVDRLARALALYQDILPRGQHDFDDRAGVSLSLAEAAVLGADVQRGPGAAWAIVIGTGEAGGRVLDEHPLGRTIYVHPIRSAQEVAAFVTPSIQTIAVAPWRVAGEIRDACALRGASRFVELGMNNVFRIGGTHDGMYPMQRLVRIVSTESPASVHVKGISVPVDQTLFLEENRFVEFIP
jgi:long-chain-fatty-acyl-CoA reductase